MADMDQLAIEARETAGKGASRALRRAGKVPAIIYGDKKEPVTVVLDRRILDKELHRGGFTNRLYELVLGDRKQPCLPRDLQVDPVSDAPLHVDFLRVATDSMIVIDVPIQFVGEEECVGLIRGGVLNVVRHDIEMNCPAMALPEYVEISLEGVDIGDSIHISDITLPDRCTPTITDRDFTVVTLVAPTVEAEPEVAEEEEGEEGEVVAEGEEGDAAEGETAPEEGGEG